MMMDSKLAFLVVLLALCSGISGCKQQQQRPALRRAEHGTEGRMYGGTYRLNMLRGSPAGLDPVTISSKLADDIALNLFDRLLTFDTLLRVQPELATRWEVDTSGTSYVFHLRSDVRFHDDPCFPGGKGRRLTARDVAYSYGRACDPRAKSVAFWAFQNRVVGANTFFDSCAAGTMPPARWPYGITVVDDTTLHIALTAPFAPFLQTLANGFGCIVPREAVERYGKEFTRHPVGSGAFTFASWQEDRNMVLTRNPHYWGRDADGNPLPYLDTLDISFVQDDGQQFLAFKQGTLDECFSLPTEVFGSVVTRTATGLTLKPGAGMDGFRLQYTPAWCTWFVDFLCSEPPFNNEHLRRAFSLSIDRHRLVQYVLQGAPAGVATGGIVPRIDGSPQVPGLGFDVRQAREELRKAGYANGKGLPRLVLTIYPEPRLKQTAEALQRMWKEYLGVNVEIEVVRFAQCLVLAEEGKLMMWGTRWYGDYPDQETFLTLFNGAMLPRNPASPSYPNSSRINDKEATALIERGVREPDDAERGELYRKSEEKLAYLAPAALLFYDMHYRMLQPWVRGYALDPMARFVLKRAWFAY